MSWFKFSFAVAILFSFAAHADICVVGATYNTSIGNQFECVKISGIGASWKDPSGLIWGSLLSAKYKNNAIQPDKNGTVVDSPAAEACAKIEGQLPTASQYEKLISYFELNQNQRLTDQGAKDFYTIFSDMSGRGEWSSSVNPGDSDAAYAFSAEYGGPLNSDRNLMDSVRCVAKART
jgi:hypothetical protein